MAYLIFQNQSGKETIKINEDGEFHLGRCNQNDITILEDPLVSRNHCMIYNHPQDKKFVLRDLQSKNGTGLNDVMLSGEEAYLSDGDKLMVGSAEFIFCIENPERFQSTTTSIIKFGKLKQGDEPQENASQAHETLQLTQYSEMIKAESTPVQRVENIDSAASLTAGMEINGYQIIRVLSTSDKSTVYLAYQTKVKRTVALKIMTINANNDIRNYFVELIQKSGRLNHPNIVHYFDCGTFGPFCYLVMGFMSEGTLEEKLLKTDSLSEKQAFSIAKKIAVSMNYALNEHGLFHLNLNPSNILFSDSDEPVINGFGLSNWFAKYYQNNRTFFYADSVYMSPEQATDQRADWRSDLYSLGIIIYQMISGKPPFISENEETIVKKHISERMVFPSGISKEASSLISMMTSKSPEERFQSWQAFINAVTATIEQKQQASQFVKQQQAPQFKKPGTGPKKIFLRK